MALEQGMPKGINVKLTERYLMGMADVLDASVWWSNGQLNAFVTVVDDSDLSRRNIQAACMNDLGVHQTPRTLELVMKRKLAA